MKIPFIIREISLRDRPEALYDISPKGTVPVLQLADNKILEESLDIMHWALKKGEQKWYLDYKTRQDQMIELNDTEFKFWLDKYKYHVPHPGKSIEYYKKKCTSFINSYDKMLFSKAYLMGDKCSLVDAALFPFIRQFANVDRNWFSNNFRNLDSWLNKWTDNNLFQSIMFKYQEWRPGDNQILVEFKRS